MTNVSEAISYIRKADSTGGGSIPSAIAMVVVNALESAQQRWKNELHRDIMNLRSVEDRYGNDKYEYKVGHRDARHAAAELVMTWEPKAALSSNGVAK
jgi:hypothetical protein